VGDRSTIDAAEGETAGGLCDACRVELDGAYRAAAVLGLYSSALIAVLGLIGEPL
jgi:hypothetical protein